jgi:type I restriction enzyme, S subunit
VTRAEFSDEYTKITKVNGRKVDDLLLEPGDLLVQRSNTPELVGTSALYAGPCNWAIFSDFLIRVRTNHEVLPAYAHLVLSSPKVHRVLRRSAKGLAGSVPKIDQGMLEGLLIPVPPVAAQAEEFNRKVKRLRAEPYPVVRSGW